MEGGIPKIEPVVVHPVYQRFVKRTIDFSIALTVLVLFWWVYAAIALLVRAKLGSRVIFRQPRPGRIDPVTARSASSTCISSAPWLMNAMKTANCSLMKCD